MSGPCACIIDACMLKPAIADHEPQLRNFMKQASCREPRYPYRTVSNSRQLPV